MMAPCGVPLHHTVGIGKVSMWASPVWGKYGGQHGNLRFWYTLGLGHAEIQHQRGGARVNLRQLRRRSGSHHLAFYFVVACEITKKSSLRSQVRSKSLYSRQDAIAAAHQLYIVVFGRGETLFAQSLSNVVVGANHVFMQVMPGQLIQRAREPKRHVQGAGGCPRLRLWSRAV